MRCKEEVGVPGFEHIGSILNCVLVDIVSALPPASRAEAIEALAERGIRFTMEILTIAYVEHPSR